MNLLDSVKQKVKGLKPQLGRHSISRLRSQKPTSSDQRRLDHEAADLEDRPPIATLIDYVSTDNDSTVVIGDPPKSVLPKTPKKRFAQTENAQQDIAALYVAYILQASPDLQDLILEILKLSEVPDFKDSVVQTCVDFTTQLIAALDSQVDGVEEAIAKFLKTIKTVDSNESPQEASDKISCSITEVNYAHPSISTIFQMKHSSRFSKVTSSVLGVALPMLQILKEGSSMIPLPMVQPLIGVVAGFLQAADQASNNFEWMRYLSATSAEYVVRIAVNSPRQEDQRWTRAIDTLQGKLSEIVQQAEEFCRRSIVSRFLNQGRDQGEITMIKETLKAAIDIFNVEVKMNIKLDLDNMSRKIDGVLLDNLPRLPSHEVSPDNYFRASRETEIQDILQWIEDPHNERFLWIYGAVGVGKSTLARRLLAHVKGEGILAAFAYFAIGIDTDPQGLVRMMARELSSLHPGCRPDVARAIKECSGTHQGLDEYLTHYMVQPIASLTYAGSLVIILDGLDEWAHRETFLKALLQINLPPTLSLKFVITSRYLSSIACIVKGAARIHQLNPVSKTVCADYFQERFKAIQWDGHDPNKEKFDKLIELADGLLIWAATVCKLVSDLKPNKRPDQVLDEIIFSSPSNWSHGQRMEELYRQALQRTFPDNSEELVKARSKIFHSMVALRETLPLTEFARLVNMFPGFVKVVCSCLRALQTRGTSDDSIVQPAIKLFHASFIDYFGPLDQARDVMVDNCIHFFKQVTEANAVEKRGPFLFRQAERYMGKHWVYHLQEVPHEKRSEALLKVTSDHLRLWAGWSLSYLVSLGDEHSHGRGSDELRSLSDALVATQGITYSPEMLSYDMSATEIVAAGFRETLDLGGIEYRNANFYSKKQEDAQRWAHVINGLAICMQQMQWLTSPTAPDLDVVIDLLENLIKAYPPDVQEHPFLLDNLGHVLHTRFEFSHSHDDIERAISLHTKARGLRQKDTLDYTISLDKLACALHSRFKYVGSHSDDLNEAISLHRRALDLQHPSHPLRFSSFYNLANALLTRFRIEGQQIPLNGAISLHRQGLEPHPTPHPHRSTSLNTLATFLTRMEHLEEAIAYYREALTICPPGHPNRSMPLRNLACAVGTRYEQSGMMGDLEESFMLYEQAANDLAAGSKHRLAAAIQWANAARHHRHSSVICAYSMSLRLLGHCLISYPNVESQQKFLATSQIPRSLASDAASAAIDADNLKAAVELLEQGRAILWSKMEGYRYPLDMLRQVDKPLANRLEMLSAELEHSTLSSGYPPLDSETPISVARLEAQMQRHRILSADWEKVVGEVRKLEGFSNFLQAIPFSTLRTTAVEGPVILINISEYRSDAIIVHINSPPILVNLPEATPVRLITLGCNLASARDAIDSSKYIVPILRALWNDIVSPVLDHLSQLGVPEKSRVWWCPTSELCALPLHAAGPYQRQQKNLPDIYTSSYIPTVSALIRARSNMIGQSVVPKLLLIGQPGEELPYVEDEIDNVRQLGDFVDVMVGRDATRETVLHGLQQHSWAHFACHGRLGDNAQPFHASFELHGGSRLTLLDLIQASLPNAELAFLSACHSAAGDSSTPDETIHLAAALQFCGFRSVVGTLWEMDDRDGRIIAKEFYKYMFRNAANKADFRDSAEALNQAIQTMRKNLVPLERWIMFVHIGA